MIAYKHTEYFHMGYSFTYFKIITICILGGVPGQHNPPPSILYPVSAHAMNAAAVQQQQAAAVAAAQQQQNTQPPTPGAQ